MRRFLVLSLLLVVSLQLWAEGDDDKVIVVLSPMDFYEKLKASNEALIIDTRPASDYEDFRMPNSVSAPQRSVLFPILEQANKNAPVFVYCGMGAKSGIVCKLIKEKGFKKVYNLKGGLRSWKRKDMPLDKVKKNG